MERHLLHSALVRVFSGQATPPEVETVDAHVAHCPPCLDRAASVIAELERAGLLAPLADERGAAVILLAAEQHQGLSRLRARALWAELRGLPTEEQLQRIEADASLQTQEMFETVVADASARGLDDPFLGEETALVAYALAGKLPEGRYPEPLRNDDQSEAMGVGANCRRMAGDWRGSAAGFKSARSHLELGTGAPEQEARLLSLQTSLASDTGHLEQALDLLARASAIYRRLQDSAAAASVTVQEASTLLAACRYEEAVARAEEALTWVSPREVRLQMLARNIITESLVFLGRPIEALRSFVATRPFYEQFQGRRTELQLSYLEALLLDSLGHAREAEKAFHESITGRMEAELYKDAFLTMLTYFEALFRRGVLAKAARACEEALEMIEQAGAGCHAQIVELWRDLLNLVNTRRLEAHHLLSARLYLARHWHAPAHHAPLERALGITGASVLAGAVLNGSATLPAAKEHRDRLPIPAGPPAPVSDLAGGGYEEALERYDRALITVGLAQCDGRVGETSRLLGISRNTLRTKVKAYGLTAGALSRRCDAQGAGLYSLPEEDEKELSRMRARAWWTELKRLPAQEQMDRFKAVLSLQTQEMFEAVLADASAMAPTDPRLGEEKALVAHALAGMFPRSRLSNDLQGTAMGEVGNCRRLAGDWQDSAAALAAARAHLELGLGEPEREARLLSIHASLASDTGHPEQALAFQARASSLSRKAKDSAVLSAVTVQEASVLLAASRHEEAIAKAEQALRTLTPREIRLEMLARNILTECLAFLGRPAEALRSLVATLPLFQQLWGRRTEFQLSYLEAVVLDSLGFAREAEAAFRDSIRGRMEVGLYKDAFLTLLTRFELLVRRGSLDEAARACEEAIEMIEEAGEAWHAQTIELWRDLLSLVNARRLTEHRLLEARHSLVRCCAGPRQPVALALPAAAQPVGEPGPALVPEPPAAPSRLAPGEYEEALARYDRKLIAAGLAQCQGRIGETCRLLGISRSALVAKMKRYGLRGE